MLPATRRLRESMSMNLHLWLPPIWLLGAGFGLGLFVLAVAFGITAAISRRAGRVLWDIGREGFLLPIFILAATMALIAIPASLKTPVKELVNSLLHRVAPETVDRQYTVVVGHPETFVFTNQLEQLRSVKIEVDHDLNIRPGGDESDSAVTATATPERPWEWQRGLHGGDFFKSEGSLHVTAASDEPTTLKVHYLIRPDFPESQLLPGTALALIGLVGVYLAIRLAFPKTSAVAQATMKESLAQPLFWLLLGIGATALLISIYIPYFTFGEDIKMVKLTGFVWITILSLALGLWTASVSLADEIEGRTALTVLSKPLGRPQFILGKFLGILLPVVLMFSILGTLFLCTLSYKVVYESREGAQMDSEFKKEHEEWQKGMQSSLNWQYCDYEMTSAIPGLVLAFFETVVLVSISVAISTRLPMVPNLIISGTIYVLGHIVPMIGNSKMGDRELVSAVQVKFVARFFATILPVLEHFDVQAAVSSGRWVPIEYLGWAGLYCVLYSSMALLLALFLFEDRDLA